MLKKSFNIMLLTSLFLGSSLLSNEIILDKNSEAGQIILKSDKEYKEYLSKLVDNKSLEQLLYKQECDINMLKEAVAKLIKNMDNLLEHKKEVESLKEKIKEMELRKNNIKKSISKDSISKNSILEENLKDSISIERAVVSKEPVFEKEKESCKKVIKTYTESDIKGSYIQYIPNKEYRVQSETLDTYNIPTISSQKEETIFKKGDIIIADKYTKAGWVHVLDKGWVKGYLLYPKVLQEDVKVNLVEVCE